MMLAWFRLSLMMTSSLVKTAELAHGVEGRLTQFRVSGQPEVSEPDFA